MQGTMGLLFILIVSFTGCGLLSENPTETADKGTLLPSGGTCANLSAEQQAKGDSLVALATETGITSIEDMFQELNNNDWDKAKNLTPSQAHALFKQALEVAPGHCEALFGYTITSLSMVFGDQELDKFIKHVKDSYNDSNYNGPLLKVSQDFIGLDPKDAPVVLLKANQNINRVEEITILEIQTLIENSFLPRIDTAIARLQTIMTYDNFAFEFTVNNNTSNKIIQIDRGEIGPLLAAAKYFKTFMLMIVSRELQSVMLNNSFDWVKTLNQMKKEDYLSPTAEQTTALDHATGLFLPTSTFTSIRPEWKAAYNGIPDILLSAIDDIQAGLQYGITESQQGTASQVNDPYIVGTGPNSDVDPADFQEAIVNLERLKKYLQGEVLLSYNKGTSSIRVNVRKYFELQGFQQYLPYFEFNPYNDWNTVVRADTSWYSTLNYSSATIDEIALNLGYSEGAPIYLSYLTFVSGPDADLLLSFWNNDTLAILSPVPGSPCSYNYTKFKDLILDPVAGYIVTPAPSSGNMVLQGCKVENGILMYADYINDVKKGPFYFTDPNGVKSFGPEDTIKVKDPIDLKGLVYFRDPTFGGIFPDLTNDNIWEIIQSLNNVQPRLMRNCMDFSTNTTVDVNQAEYDNNFNLFNCKFIHPGAGGSDLDILVFYLKNSNNVATRAGSTISQP